MQLSWRFSIILELSHLIPIRRVQFSKVPSNVKAYFTKGKIDSVFAEYIRSSEIDYTRLRWLLRRLSQVGAPGGVEFIAEHFKFFLPALAEVATYFESAKRDYKGDWKSIGANLTIILKSDGVRASAYLRVVLLSFFASIRKINHIDQITKLYDTETVSCRREIVLAAANAKEADWVRKLKAEYKSADPWLRRAILHACRILPADEQNFWAITAKKRASPLELAIIKSA